MTASPLLYRASPLHKPAGMWEVESELGHPVCTVNDEATARLFAHALNTRPGGYHATQAPAVPQPEAEAQKAVADEHYLQLARTLEFTKAELDVYRSTFGQRDTGIVPSTGAVKLTDEQHTLAHKVKVLAEIALGRGTKLPLHTRRKNLCAAIDELAALATPSAGAPRPRAPLDGGEGSGVPDGAAQGVGGCVMEFYVIRHKPTQTFMPGRGLATHYDFDRPVGTHEPRLFKTEWAAKNCATCWAQGIWHAEIKTESEGWEYPSYEYQDCPVPITVPGRKRDDLEVLKVLLVVQA